MPSLGVDQTQHLETSEIVYYITLQTPHISVESAKILQNTNVMMQTVYNAIHNQPHAVYNQQNAESMIQDLSCDRCEIWLQCKLGMEHTVKPPLTVPSLQWPLFCSVDTFTHSYIHSYFNLSTTATSPQLQQPLKHISTAKMTSQQRPVHQRLMNSANKSLIPLYYNYHL